MNFQSTITIGNILEILTIAVGGLLFLFEMRNRLNMLNAAQEYFKARLDKVDSEIIELSKVTNMLTVQKERLDTFDKRLSSFSDRMNKLDTKVDGFSEKLDSLSKEISQAANHVEEKIINYVKDNFTHVGNDTSPNRKSSYRKKA